AQQLNDNGMSVLLDQNDIGANLHDHILVSGDAYATPVPIESSGLHASVAVLYAASKAGGPRDILLNISTRPSVFPPLESPKMGFKASFSYTRPQSRGRLTLTSDDPLAAPRIDLNAFADPSDMDGALAALEVSRTLFADKAFARFSPKPAAALPAVEDKRALIKAGSTTFGHYSGTCRMGTDESAPVDVDLGVKGVSGLFVVDASVFPAAPSSPTNALTLALAERAADLLKAT
ncbi:MAG: GMC family oxidoreductase, partial [Pseudomonadota bacterium]